MKQVSLTVSILVLVSVLMLAAGARPACAQLPGAGLPSGVGVSAFFPSGGVAQDKGGSVQAALELRYALPSVPLTPSRTVLGIGAEWGSRNGGHSTIVPITVAEFVGLTGKSPAANGSPYAGIGVGAYFLDQSGYGQRVQLGGFGALGYNFPGGLFIEGKYQVVNRGNGGLISLGFRF